MENSKKKVKAEDFNTSRYMETEDYKQKNEFIKNEINLHKVEIDRSVFIKTIKEKFDLKKLKKESNSNGLKDILDAFARAKSPNWGSFKFNGLLINSL